MKKGFTLLEMIVVIVVISIIAVTMLPKMDRNFKQELADNIMSDIQYARYMATSDFKQSNNDPEWQRTLWNISFNTCEDGGVFTSVNTDLNKNKKIDLRETVVDKMTNKYMYGNKELSCKNGGGTNSSSRIFLTDQYSVASVTFTGGCEGTDKIGFDHLGRPHVGFEDSLEPNYASIMEKTCFVRFKLQDNTSVGISIAPETGHITRL